MAEINILANKGSDYWSFKGNSKRSIAHALIQYPAMMVPQMQGELIDMITSGKSDVRSIFDPFVGSGTTLSEAMMRGLDFGGIDINPLAILACQTKSGPYYPSALKQKISALINRICTDKSNAVDHQFKYIDKWFEQDVQRDLCKIRRNIKKESSLWARRFFWLSLCDTVRKVCNSRSTTYKLHIKKSLDIENISLAIPFFINKLENNFEHYNEQKQKLDKGDFITKGIYKSRIDITLSDIKEANDINKKYDLLISSPPYGDNGTTVTYGQYSFLPLNWIDTKDISEHIPRYFMECSTGIDTASLGGNRKDIAMKHEAIKNNSASYSNTRKRIPATSTTGKQRLTSFVFDIDAALDIILNKLNPNAYLIWTLGNRRIANKEIPLDLIFKELLEHKGCEYLTKISRPIPVKRMPGRNKQSVTMNKETILIMKNKNG